MKLTTRPGYVKPITREEWTGIAVITLFTAALVGAAWLWGPP